MEKNDIEVTRIFNCPQKILFEAWSEPGQIEQWYGPRGFNTKVEKFDFVVGGKWKYLMESPDKKQYPVIGTFETIEPPNKIVSSDGWADDPTPSMTPDMSLTVEFQKIDENNTKLILTIHLKSAEDKAMWEKSGAVQGYESSFNKLEELLKKG